MSFTKLQTGIWKSTPTSRIADPQKLVAIVADWAGTTIDFGSRAPAYVFVEIFRRKGIEMTESQARGPMGMAKREHIATLTQLTEVDQQWTRRYGQSATDDDIDAMYDEFLPLQLETLRSHGDLIPGVKETIDACRKRGLKIGSSTGYTHELMKVVSECATQQGYTPDAVICSDDVPFGRPTPWMLCAAAEKMNAYPLSSIVKIDDTTVGIEAGRNAGSWTVGVTATGNLIGLTQSEWNALDDADRSQRLETATHRLFEVGAHYVVESMANLLPVLDDIDDRLAVGEMP